MNTCETCKYTMRNPFEESSLLCKAVPPTYTGGEYTKFTSWHSPVVRKKQQACIFFQPKEEVPALGGVLGEQP